MNWKYLKKQNIKKLAKDIKESELPYLCKNQKGKCEIWAKCIKTDFSMVMFHYKCKTTLTWPD